MRALLLLLPLLAWAQPQAEAPNAVLLVAKPGMADPNFREAVVLVTQAADASTVGVILNRPGGRKHERSGETVYVGGPVMREVLVAVYRSDRKPNDSAFPVLKGVYLTMHPHNIDQLLAEGGRSHRLYAGFAGWIPGQLESELARDAWHVLPANIELLFRNDTRGMWQELVNKVRGRVAMW